MADITRFELENALVRGDNNESPVPVHNMAHFINNHVLVGGIAETITVPMGAKVLSLTASADLWLDPTEVALVPIADRVDGTGLLLMPSSVTRMFAVEPGEEFSMISATNCVVSEEYFS